MRGTRLFWERHDEFSHLRDASRRWRLQNAFCGALGMRRPHLTLVYTMSFMYIRPHSWNVCGTLQRKTLSFCLLEKTTVSVARCLLFLPFETNCLSNVLVCPPQNGLSTPKHVIFVSLAFNSVINLTYMGVTLNDR